MQSALNAVRGWGLRFVADGSALMSVASAALVLVLAAAPAAAGPMPFGLGQDLRLEGFVDPAEGADTLGTIQIRAGDVVRRFGVVRAQTAQAEGMSLFNRSEQYPEQLLLRGSKDELDRFRTAPSGAHVRMLGRYKGLDFVLAEIAITAAPAPPGR